jgi:MPBQ/MSBQ methyltransferase
LKVQKLNEFVFRFIIKNEKMTKIQQEYRQIIQYFEAAGLDYQAWSEKFNMHFGFYKWGMNPFSLEPMLEQMSLEIMRRLQIGEHKNPFVIDAGCGVGASSRLMAREIPNAEFYGITITPWQIKFGTTLNEEADLDDRITLMQADYQEIPIKKDYADAAFALESACYAKGADKKEFIKEMARILKPGARLVVADGFLKHSKPLPSWLDGIYRRNLNCWALTQLADIQLFVKAMEAAGFTNIVVEDISWKVAPSFCHIPKTCIKFFWKRLFERNAAPLNRERINNVLAPIYGMVMGLSRRHFTYAIVSGTKS